MALSGAATGTLPKITSISKKYPIKRRKSVFSCLGGVFQRRICTGAFPADAPFYFLIIRTTVTHFRLSPSPSHLRHQLTEQISVCIIFLSIISLSIISLSNISLSNISFSIISFSTISLSFVSIHPLRSPVSGFPVFQNKIKHTAAINGRFIRKHNIIIRFPINFHPSFLMSVSQDSIAVSSTPTNIFSA